MIRLFPLGLLVAACATGRPPPSRQLATLKPETAAQVKAMNQTALGLYPAAPSGNFVFSAASIYWAFLLLEPGARGTTQSQLHAFLHTRAPHAESPALMQGLQTSETAGLRIANGLFGQPTFPFDPAFLAAGRDRYGALLETLDFEGDAKGAQKHINAWVSERTNARIPELMTGDSPSPDTRLVLVNAVYFLAAWRHPFSLGATKDGPFTTEDGAVVQTPMMKHTSDWLYGESGPVRVLELTYRGTDVVFDLVLPKDPGGLRDVEAQLAERLDGWLGGLKEHEVNLTLPRFKVQATMPGLVEALKARGLTDAFDVGKVDLSGIAGKPGDLVVSNVVHQAFIEVNEKGTEAAAATAIDVVLTSMPIDPPPVVDFVVDHPFLFVLRDSKTQAILFLGRVGKPDAPPAPKE